MTVILGIDPGSRKTGFGLVEATEAGNRYVSSGVIKLPVEEPLAIRLKVLAESLHEIIDEFSPTLAAIEEVFMNKSAGSALKLGQARGAAMVICATRNLEVHEYATRQIKQAVVGTGGATKEQVQPGVGLGSPRRGGSPRLTRGRGLAVAVLVVGGGQQHRVMVVGGGELPVPSQHVPR